MTKQGKTEEIVERLVAAICNGHGSYAEADAIKSAICHMNKQKEALDIAVNLLVHLPRQGEHWEKLMQFDAAVSETA